MKTTVYFFTSEYDNFCSKSKNVLLKKFVDLRLLPYYEANTIESHFKKEEATYHELEKALKHIEYDITKIDSLNCLKFLMNIN